MIHSVTQDKLISDDTQCYTEYTDQYWYTVLHRIYWSVMRHGVTQDNLLISDDTQCYTGKDSDWWWVMIHSVTQDILISDDTQCYYAYIPAVPVYTEPSVSSREATALSITSRSSRYFFLNFSLKGSISWN